MELVKLAHSILHIVQQLPASHESAGWQEKARPKTTAELYPPKLTPDFAPIYLCFYLQLTLRIKTQIIQLPNKLTNSNDLLKLLRQ